MMIKNNLAPFKVPKPCSECPFRNDDKGVSLAGGRLEEIVEGLLIGRESSFPCHKTVYKRDLSRKSQSSWSMCPGAAAVARKCGRDTQLVQVSTRLGAISKDFLDESMALTIEPNELKINYARVHLGEPSQ